MKHPGRSAIACAAVLAVIGCGAAEQDAPAAGTPETMPAAALTAPDGLLDPNAATAEELAAVEGMDAALTEALVAGRPYADMLAVDAVLSPRLSEAQRDAVYTRVWMPLDLNGASETEILLIPGVGERLAEEFEEYRPYDAIERFRREIGKYVDEAEVARLERYVTIR